MCALETNYPMGNGAWSALRNPFPSQYPLANPVVSPNFASANLGYAPNIFRHPDQASELSGYLSSEGKTRDDSKGKYLEFILQHRSIDLQDSPPFKPVTSKTTYNTHGVVKLSNIPFTVNAQEILQFISRNTQIPMLKKHVEGFPIHIIMEKPTGKTMDCFIEFPNHVTACECVAKFTQNDPSGRAMRLGSRNVNVNLSTQAELSGAIFPRARLVRFDARTGKPTILPKTDDADWTEGFRGYFTIEEIHGVVRFAESPSRSPFVLKAHQRVYECMISTLYKFPWAATDTYTIAARNALFEAAYKQLEILSQKVGASAASRDFNGCTPYSPCDGSRYSSGSSNSGNCSPYSYGNREVGLSQTLLFDLLFAALNVPTFNILQKGALCQAAGAYGRGITLSQFSESWPFQILEPVDGVHDDNIRFWLELFDTGFDIMEEQGELTGYEDFLIFNRNEIGFPIAEWTAAGVELLFDKAAEMEVCVVSRYMNCGRHNWAKERQIKLDLSSCRDLTESFYSRGTIRSGHRLASTYYEADEDISPKSSRDLGGCPLPNTPSTAWKTDLNDIASSSSAPTTGCNKLNAATAIDFVPASRQEQTPSDASASRLIPTKLTLDTNLARPASISTVVLQAPSSQIDIAKSHPGYQTPPQQRALSAAGASDPGPFSKSPDSGVKLPFNFRHPRSLAFESGLPDHILGSFHNFSFTSNTSNTGTSRLKTKTIQPRSSTATHDFFVESPGAMLATEKLFQASSAQDSFTPPLKSRTKTLPELQFKISRAQSPIRVNFGPIGSTRPSTVHVGLVTNSEQHVPVKQHRAYSTPYIEDMRVSSGGSSMRTGANGGRLSATELWQDIKTRKS